MRRNGVLILLVALAIITFLDRISISVAGPRIQRDLGIRPERWGWILGAFVLAYGIFEIPTGALGDRSGHKKVLTRIVLWWSAFTCFTGLATGFNVLLATRFLFGAGEAGAYPNIAGVMARWFPAKERARTQGFIWAASRFGGALSPLLVVPLQSIVGWRAAFAILGAVGLLWVLCWNALYRDAPDVPPEAALVARVSVPWRELAHSSQLRLILAMYFCQAFGSWFYFGWFPVYLVKGAGFTEAQMGIFSALPFLLGATGSLAGGFLSDRLASRLGLKNGRRLVGCVGLAASALLLVGMTLTRNRTAIVVLSSLGFGVADLMLPAAWAICLDIGGRHSGVVTGSMNTAGQLGGFLCAVLFGYVVKATGNYSAPVWMVAGMVMAGAILFSRIDATRTLVETPGVNRCVTNIRGEVI
ncbi:MAG: MFS transporter [Acidobacteriota bacterium]|nr:MFS transporter [Acidobacteriota bacterium]